MDDLSDHKLRRAWFRGYRAVDVQLVLAQASLRVTQLVSDLESTRSRLEAADSERRELTQLLAEAHRRELETAATAEAARGQAARDAEARAEEVIDQAHLDAARIRAEAAVDSERVRSQVEDLLRLRESLAATIRLVTRDVDRVLKGEALPAAPAPPAPVAAPEPAAAPAPVHVPEATRPLFAQSVEIDAGPFEDFASLSAFERALGSLPKVGDVYVRRFQGDRATIEVTLDEPAPLLDDLTEGFPYRLSIDHTGDDRIELSISSDA